MADPEFIALNPGLSQTAQEAGAALLSLANDSDVIEQLTDWIAHDPAAMDFINGKADPWGMKVNPSVQEDQAAALGVAAARHLRPADRRTPVARTTRLSTSPSSPHRSPRCARSSDALLDAWPNVQTRCDADLATQSYKLGRIDRQPFGSRFMLGVVSLGDAARYGLRAAALQTKKGTYVAPDDARSRPPST